MNHPASWRLRRTPRPTVSVHIAGQVLTVVNTGRCPAEVVEVSIVPLDRSRDARHFGPGSVLAELRGTTVGVLGSVTLDVGDSLHAFVEEHMIARPIGAGSSFDVRGRVVVGGLPRARVSPIASFDSHSRQQPTTGQVSERELRARLMWGFS